MLNNFRKRGSRIQAAGCNEQGISIHASPAFVKFSKRLHVQDVQWRENKKETFVDKTTRITHL
jgi:hypothetical protein